MATQDNDEPCAIEILDSQTDVGYIVQQAGHELLSDDITNAVTRSEHEERSSTRVGVLLLHGIEQSTPSPEACAGLARLIMSRKLEVTFEEKQFWSRLSERLRRSPVGDGLC